MMEGREGGREGRRGESDFFVACPRQGRERMKENTRTEQEGTCLLLLAATTPSLLPFSFLPRRLSCPTKSRHPLLPREEPL